MSAIDLRGAVCIVTGASSGIGRATALAFAREGAHVVLAARRTILLERVAAEARAHGVEALVTTADVSRREDIDRVVRETLGRFGRIDVLVNNAGFGFSATIEDTPERVMRELIDVNYIAAFNLSRLVLPHMRARGGGHIVNVASVVGKISFPFHGAYAASKFAMVAMTEALRGELAGSGVTATVVLPASTRTEFFEAQGHAGDHVSGPTGPVQSPERVARAIVRSVRRPTPEVNLMPPLRIAYGIHGFFPALRDIAGRLFYRYRTRRSRSTAAGPTSVSGERR
ncbi:MAG TPA: SDR family oxidoreductase [Dehalococcoidia bacterium]|nr:SDR family oxidoreductase [Dehalococcoidia bacterium]